jgi:ABC-2 type transport system ATP-binding protein
MLAQQGILAERLSKVYVTRKRQSFLRTTREEKVAVHDLSFHFPPGQVTGLLGLNGAGKTTTIKMLSTLLLPTGGRITVDGLDIVQHTRAIRKRINMIAGGERMVYWRLTGRENLWYFAQLYDVESRTLNARIDALLTLVGLQDAADTVVERYSKGMKQRLQIARGLINDPAYLFMDEPTIGLDAPIARELRQMVRRLAGEGKGVLLTSHYLNEVEELCAYIYVIDQGRLVAEGSPDQLKVLTRQNRVVRVLLPERSAAVEQALQDIVRETGARLTQDTQAEGIVLTVAHPDDLSARVAATVALNGGSMLKLEVIEPTLEDAMLVLTGAARTQEVAHVGQ